LEPRDGPSQVGSSGRPVALPKELSIDLQRCILTGWLGIVLRRKDELIDPLAQELALWFHDAVYETRNQNNALGKPDRSTTAFQPRRLMITPAAAGCKHWLAGLHFRETTSISKSRGHSLPVTNKRLLVAS
jgi:hypothetical protein